MRLDLQRTWQSPAFANGKAAPRFHALGSPGTKSAGPGRTRRSAASCRTRVRGGRVLRKLWLMLFLVVTLVPTVLFQTGCAALAGGAVGAAVGHEIAEEDEEDD